MTRVSEDDQRRLSELSRLAQERRTHAAEARARLELRLAAELAAYDESILTLVAQMHAVPVSRIGKALGTKDYRTAQALCRKAWEAQQDETPTLHLHPAEDGYWTLSDGTATLLVRRDARGRYKAGVTHPAYTSDTDPDGTLRAALRDPDVQDRLREEA